MGAAKYIRKTFQNEWKGVKDANYNYDLLLKHRAMDYRHEETAVAKVEYPTNLVAAKSVGYKAKEGIFVVRVRVRKGTGTHHRPKNKRRPKRQGQNKLTKRISIQAMSEQKASKYFENAEALGSYKVAEDGQWHYYEVVLVDRTHPAILADKELSWITDDKGRAERGRTFAGRSNKQENLRNTRKHRGKVALDHHYG